MVLDVHRLEPPPAGFPNCSSCIYQFTGTPAVCYACATTAPLRPPVPACEVCAQPLVDGSCTNTVCSFADRQFSQLYTVSERPDDVWTAVCRYKYDEDRSWSDMLGRIFAGYLEKHRPTMERFDVITNGALYVGPRANRLWDHLRPIMESASRYGPTWPIAAGVIAKSGPSGQFLNRSTDTRRKIAEHSLRPALSVPEPDRVRGRRVLVLDDVYSEGFSMREMARVLLQAGAAEVAGVVFARRKGG